MSNTKKKNQKNQQAQFLNMVQEKIPEEWAHPRQGEALKPERLWEIEHVYGFSGDRMKGGLQFGANNNEVLYSAAALGIKLDLQQNEQSFFGGIPYSKTQEKYTPGWPVHQDDITTIDVCYDRSKGLAVTGECGAKSTVHVWDINTMQSVSRFDLGDKCKGVASVAISPCARYIATVDQSNDHNVSVFNVNKKKPIFSVSAGNDAISVMRWSRKANDLRFAAVTSRSIQFWNPADSSKKLFKNGAFGPNNQQTKFNCVAFDDDGVCYSGGANGAVHCWDQRGELALVLKAHSGECTAVAGNQNTLVSFGKDFKVCIHTYNKGTYEFAKQIDVETRFIASGIDYLDGSIIIGHDNGVIASVDVDSEAQQIHSVTHCDGEVWGLEVNPEKGTFYTSGDDNQFMEVDLMNRRMIRKGKVWSNDYNNGKGYELTKIRSTASTLSSCPPHQQSRAITTSKLHNHVAVANNQGDIMIFMEDDFTNCIAKLKHPQEWVEAIEYSPDSRFLAVGAHDDTIYIYKISTDGKYSLHYKIEYMHSSAVTALDWSKDSKYLRAIDQAYAKMFYDITECVHIKDGASVLTDPAIWETSTCKLGWYSSGVFRAGMDGSDINAIDSNEDRSLVAVGDDSGTLCVYRYPVRAQHHDCVRLGGHSSHVSKVRFFENGNPEDARILTAGGYDRSYIQWRQGGLSEEPEEDDINQ